MKLAEMKWPDVEALSKDTPVVIPIAAHEQHGRHMPLHTDSLLLGEIARRAEEQLGGDALFAPLQWLGNSHHHMDFPGTLSAEPRVYLDLLNGLLENFLQHGFKRLALLNGHGGNIVPGSQAVFETRQRHRDRTDLLLLSATYWEQANIAEACDDLVQDAMGHAGELETSMMLAIRPELVGDIADAAEVPKGKAFATATRGWTTKDRSEPGHIGVPAAASAKKGEALLNAFTLGVVDFAESVRDWDGQSWN
jgi:creatinine amidohydrolase